MIKFIKKFTNCYNGVCPIEGTSVEGTSVERTSVERTSVERTSVEEDTICSICQDDTLNNDFTRTKCNHLYCTQCLNTWLETRSTCPKCRAILKVDINELFAAVYYNRIEYVNQYLEDGGDIMVRDDNGSTMLIHALYYTPYKIKMMELLLKYGIDINAVNKKGDTALMISIYDYKKDIKTLDILLKNKADTSIRNCNMESALMIAVKSNWCDAVELLLEHGAKADDDIKDIIIWAVHKNQLKIIQLLLKQDVSKLILEKAFIYSVNYYHINIEIVELFLERGVDISAVDHNGKTALMFAVQVGKLEVIQILLEKGANILTADYNGKTVLMHAANNFEIIKILLEQYADISVLDNDGNNVLSYVNYNEIFLFLVERGADITIINKKGNTILMHAVYNDNIDIVKFLLEKGLKIDKNTLKIAAKGQSVEVMKFLLETASKNIITPIELFNLLNDKDWF